ncbi:TetR family transcriptional regulator [Paraliobacillus quinghaiensis]|uniref:TetR family transcriptional regulator n=1 Tax=Paraliobacillus quinghaiensis TaxID=470815 RepID=A0A917TUM3_9BACI|nr:TetR/AcrR family transcriptional regulator [Paraliobacillus quinghaiensis]GGM38147.1 TetR family transcriptional regulator [Paraliobacillus quinghaiensis]
MASLREQKKYQNQQKIINEATKSFLEKGYQETRIAEIAKKANMGTGTIYNYYPSKGSLLLAVLEDEFTRLKEDNQGVSVIPEGENLVEKITYFVKLITRFFDDFPKKFWREITHVMTEDAEESNGIRRGVFGLDQDLMNHLKVIIEDHKNDTHVPIDSVQATEVIYNIVMMESMLFIYQDEMSYQQLVDRIEQQIAFIFNGK